MNSDVDEERTEFKTLVRSEYIWCPFNVLIAVYRRQHQITETFIELYSLHSPWDCKGECIDGLVNGCDSTMG